MVFVLTGLLVIALVGWIKNCLTLHTLAYYMCAKDYPMPTDQETASCTEWVVRNALGLTK